MVRRVLVVGGVIAAVAAAPAARAQNVPGPRATTTPPSPTPVAATAEPKSPLGDVPPWFIPEGEPMKNAALEMNPLGLAIGLFSANLEYMIGVHHAALVSPHYYFASPGISDQLTGGGVEVGYRYYTGLHGPEGWFLGGSVLYGNYRYEHRVSYDASGLDLPDDTQYDSWGGAIDAGYQLLLYKHMVIGGGAGVMYRWFDTQPTFETYHQSQHDLIYGSGLRPRILLTFGGAL